MKPGVTTLTRTPCRPISRAIVFDIAIIAAFVELYSEFFGMKAVVERVPMLTMPPPPVSTMRLAASPQSVIVPITFSCSDSP